MASPHEDTYPFVPLEYQRLDAHEMLARSRAFLADMQGRRTVRQFSDEPVPFELIANAIATAGTAPSGAHLVNAGEEVGHWPV